jgi:hypothetical protein
MSTYYSIIVVNLFHVSVTFYGLLQGVDFKKGYVTKTTKYRYNILRFKYVNHQYSSGILKKRNLQHICHIRTDMVLTFRGPRIVIHSYNKINEMH